MPVLVSVRRRSAGRSSPARRWIAALALALVVLAGSGSLAAPEITAATPAPVYPTQSLGNRGTDVRAIQWLLNARGYPVSASGVFDPATAAAVTAWQLATGQPANGVVDAAAWSRLVPWLGPGAVGPAVKAAQAELRAKRHLDVAADGIWGPSTTAAVKAFQRHAGIGATGTMNGATWNRLIAHFELPSFNATSLCDYSVGNGKANWGTAAAIAQLESAARVVARAGHGRVAVGDVGFEHGGVIPGHTYHQHGLEVDVRPMRKAEDQCRVGVSYRSTAYDRAATRALVEAIRATAPGHVRVIYFNDPVLIKAGLTRYHVGHDDHLHVRYCEASSPLRMFTC